MDKIKFNYPMCGFCFAILVGALINLAYAPTSLAQSSNENLVQNGDFEQGTVAWILHPDMKLVRTSNQQGAHHVLSRSSPAPDDGYTHEVHTSQCINFGDARKFSLSAEFSYLEYPRESSAHRLNFIWFDDNKCAGGGQFGGYLEPKQKQGWQTLKLDNIQSALNSHSLLITVTQNRRASIRKLNVFQRAFYWNKSFFTHSMDLLSSGYWDNISLVPKGIDKVIGVKARGTYSFEIPVGINLLKNPDFDQGASAWQLDSNTHWDADKYKEHVGSLRVVRQSIKGSSGSGAFEQCLETGGHSKFELGGYFMRDANSTQTGSGRLRVVWFELPDCKGRHRISQQNVDPQRVDGWQHLHIANLPAPENVSSMMFDGIGSIDGVGEFIGYWDNLYLIAK
ncbi:MAG TPA: hypothetical protein PK002_09440 [Cellvibrio sp.]|nr:hypothetical protein [Cellvibrio sp.]